MLPPGGNESILTSVFRFLFFPSSKARLQTRALRDRVALAYGLKMNLPSGTDGVLFREIERTRQDISELSKKFDFLKDGDITDMKVAIAMLQVKAGVWGLIGGLIPVAVALTVQYFSHR